MKYRGVSKWSIVIKYRFDGEQLQRSINVSDAGLGPHLSFTPQETITLAREIAQNRFDK